MTLSAELTNGHGDTKIGIKLVRVTADSIEGETLLSGGVDISFANPRSTVGFGLEFRDVVFPQAGEYRFILECEGSLLLERPIILAEKT